MKLLYLVESGESKFLVFDEMPDKISTKYGDDTIIGRIGGIAGNRRLTSFESGLKSLQKNMEIVIEAEFLSRLVTAKHKQYE